MLRLVILRHQDQHGRVRHEARVGEVPIDEALQLLTQGDPFLHRGHGGAGESHRHVVEGGLLVHNLQAPARLGATHASLNAVYLKKQRSFCQFNSAGAGGGRQCHLT